MSTFGLPSVSSGVIWMILGVAVVACLLLHQLDELAEHIDQQRE
jgi:hypothetical protein